MLVEHGQELDEALTFLCLAWKAEPLGFQGIRVSQDCHSSWLTAQAFPHSPPFFLSWRF